MAFHRTFKFRLAGPNLQIHLLVQSVKLEEVAVRLPGWRGWTAIANLAEVVFACLLYTSDAADE